jgi:hypothetical protein
MPKRRADAVVNYPGQAKVVASVATTKDMIVLTLGDGREEHYTYPPDGRFHLTEETGERGKAFFAPAPAYEAVVTRLPLEREGAFNAGSRVLTCSGKFAVKFAGPCLPVGADSVVLCR